jgi:hypothetical protein
MTNQPVTIASMVDQIGAAIAKADATNFESDPSRYRRLAQVALKPLTDLPRRWSMQPIRPCGVMHSGRSTAMPISRRRCELGER